jgi:hypothetical protein
MNALRDLARDGCRNVRNVRDLGGLGRIRPGGLARIPVVGPCYCPGRPAD